MSAPREAQHVVIRGRVQGVGYRAWAVRTARSLGVDGWVRNRHDGSVEAVFAGEADAVARMVEMVRRGPPGGLVEAIDARAEPDAIVLIQPGSGLTILPTA